MYGITKTIAPALLLLAASALPAFAGTIKVGDTAAEMAGDGATAGVFMTINTGSAADRLVASMLGRWEKRCGSGSDLVRFLPGGPGRVLVEIWSSTTQPQFWAGKTEFVFEPAANRFVSTPAFGQTEFVTVLTIVDDNQLHSQATGFGRVWDCMLYRAN